MSASLAALELAQKLDPGPVSAAPVPVPVAVRYPGDLAKPSAAVAQKGQGGCWRIRFELL